MTEQQLLDEAIAAILDVFRKEYGIATRVIVERNIRYVIQDAMRKARREALRSN